MIWAFEHTHPKEVRLNDLSGTITVDWMVKIGRFLLLLFATRQSGFPPHFNGFFENDVFAPFYCLLGPVVY